MTSEAFEREAVRARVADACVCAAAGFDLDAHTRAIAELVVRARFERVDPYIALRRKEAARSPLAESAGDLQTKGL